MNVELENETVKTLFDCIESVTTLATMQFKNFSENRMRAFGLKVVEEFRKIANEIEEEITEGLGVDHKTNTQLQDDGCPHHHDSE